MRVVLLYFLLAVGVVLACYLSWIPQPDLSKIRYMPAWLGRWTNTHDTLRTAIPLVFIGFLSGVLMEMKMYPLRQWFYVWLLLTFLICLIEFVQLFLTRRVFDWRDIVWGSSGAIIGLATSLLVINSIRSYTSLSGRK
jgi:VanZ family protein